MNDLKKRDIGVDNLKFIAALLITNSHMDLLYPSHLPLSTGGAIGDVLFFFVSGFLFFLKPMGSFDNWYKKRINRIYPTVFAWAILRTLFFGREDNMIEILLYGGGWFISCIMIYYVLIYLINYFMLSRLYLAFLLSVLIVITWFVLLDNPDGYNMYGDTYFKWGHYFLFMLMGSIMGHSKKTLQFRLVLDLIKLVVCIILFYGLLYSGRNYFTILHDLQVISLVPLLGITYYFYKVANSDLSKRIYNHKIFGAIIKIIGGLCLEIYLVQTPMFTDVMNDYFPLNLLAMFLVILVAAYILRCVSRIFSQIFKEQNFDWKGVFRLY